MTGTTTTSLNAEIEALIGAPAAALLVEHHGGVRRYLPMASRLTGGHWLSQLLGPAEALQLCLAYGPGHLSIPRARTDAVDRRRQIATAPGPAHAIARRFGVTERWVYACRAAHRAARKRPAD